VQREGTPDDGLWVDRFLATRPGLQHESLVLERAHLAHHDPLVWHMDEPIADPAVIPAFLLAQRARAAGAVVMLSGMGADELFGGYRRYGLLANLRHAQRCPDGLWAALGLVAGWLQRQNAGGARRLVVNGARWLAAARDPWPLGYLNLVGYFTPTEIDQWVGAAWREPLQHKLLAACGDAPPSGGAAQAIDMPGYLASHNTLYMDKASMAASIEVRVPFLTPRLANFAHGLPEALRYTNRQEKVLLKQLCAQRIDAGIAYRPKAGFALPVRAWLQDTLNPAANQQLITSLRDILPADKLVALLAQHSSQQADHTMKIWALMHLARWREQFLAGA
jgi:asparagine synthase (glutamine-hydrolysing)